MKIALLEDEPEQARAVTSILTENGHTVEAFNTGKSFLYSVLHNSYELLILDWQLPDTEGIDVVKEVRKELNWQVPVLFLTQRDAEEDIVRALNAGADDYLVKPARAAELNARISALSRRTSPDKPPEGQERTFGPFVVDIHDRAIRLNGTSIPLTDKDFELAVFMFENVGRLLSRDFLLERVWGVSSDLNTRTVDTHVSRLRRKLGIKPENGFRIKTIYQHGYRLETVQITETAKA